MNSFSSDLDLEILSTMNSAAAAIVTLSDFIWVTSTKYREGSQPGRSSNRSLNARADAFRPDCDLFRRYQSGPPQFTNNEFERIYCMPRQLYEEVGSNLRNHKYFLSRSQMQQVSVVQVRACTCLLL